MAGFTSCSATRTTPPGSGGDDSQDSIAFTREADPEDCPELNFVADGNTFRPITAPGVSMKFFEVPTTGFSANGAMYVFVWTDHADLGNGMFSNAVGHAALLRSDDNGRNYRKIWEDLGDKLVDLAAAVVNNADVPGLGGSGQTLLIWGSGKFYRASNPYLAMIPLANVENKSAVRYYTCPEGAVCEKAWGLERHAQPLFQHPCIGELSVSWNRNLRTWLMLYNCDADGGIVARLSDTPWGPWSAPALIFDPAADAGSCYFIRGDGDCGPPGDPTSPQGADHPGGAYGPYVIPRYTRGGPQTTTIYYVLSTWNPYDVVLMRTTLALDSPLPFGRDTCIAGFVWREAVPDDHVCVSPATRNATAQQNEEADTHRAPNGGAFGLETCLQGFVWRNAFPGDHVCVTPAFRQQAASDNTAAKARRAGG
jgi:hypothetical protein